MANYSTTYRNQYNSIIKTPQQGSAEYGKVEKDAAQEYADRLKAIDMRIKQVQALRDADSEGIRRNQNLAQRDINDQMFREYLSSRERMGGRGVSNSGLMADAQIRLNANKQDRMAQLYSQTQDKLSEANRMYAPQQTELLGERQNTRQSKIFQEMFDKVLENRAREAGMLAPLVQNEFQDEQRGKTQEFQRGERINTQQFQKGERINTQQFQAGQNKLERQNQLSMNAARIAADTANTQARIDADNSQAQAKLDFDKENAKLTREGATKTERVAFYVNIYENHRADAETLLNAMANVDTSTDEGKNTYNDLLDRYDKARAKQQAALEISKQIQEGK